mmetsp:Transcript_78029/g.135275  ORF Transcript_78029/g.135275 Transcript_78029/m.135275 type:complete len:203 (-) Transcript_78029:2084-2692(-)
MASLPEAHRGVQVPRATAWCHSAADWRIREASAPWPLEDRVSMARARRCGETSDSGSASRRCSPSPLQDRVVVSLCQAWVIARSQEQRAQCSRCGHHRASAPLDCPGDDERTRQKSVVAARSWNVEQQGPWYLKKVASWAKPNFAWYLKEVAYWAKQWSLPLRPVQLSLARWVSSLLSLQQQLHRAMTAEMLAVRPSHAIAE